MPFWLCAGTQQRCIPGTLPIQQRNNRLRTSLHGDTDPAACDLFPLKTQSFDIKDTFLGVLVATVLLAAMLLALSVLVVLCVIRRIIPIRQLYHREPSVSGGAIQ